MWILVCELKKCKQKVSSTEAQPMLEQNSTRDSLKVRLTIGSQEHQTLFVQGALNNGFKRSTNLSVCSSAQQTARANVHWLLTQGMLNLCLRLARGMLDLRSSKQP